MKVISGALKNYAWGIPGGLLPWLGDIPGSETTEPQAELWFGVHPSGASKIIDSDLALSQVFDRREVPVLVKILAAAKPLSVQVHPRRELAQEGFDELTNTEQFAGAFADPYQKTELLYALTSFKAFCGWRPIDQVMRILAELRIDLPATEWHGRGNPRRTLFEYFVAQKVSPETLAAIPMAVREIGLSDCEIDAYTTVAADYPLDQGALLAVFLQSVILEPGDSVYIPAGMPHSYISGIGIEVMTSSDNVLRLGLTPKAVYPELALRALDFESDLPPAAQAPFSIDVLQGDPQAHYHFDLASGQFRLVLALDGITQIGDTALFPGQAAVITATEPVASISTIGRCAVVRTKI
jgi:mannose-6-phosphate isomerase